MSKYINSTYTHYFLSNNSIISKEIDKLDPDNSIEEELEWINNVFLDAAGFIKPNPTKYLNNNSDLLCGQPWPLQKLNTKDIHDTIFIDFINLVKDGDINNEDILEFSKNYGLLISRPQVNSSYGALLHFEPIDFWKNEIALMYSLARTYYFYESLQLDKFNQLFQKRMKIIARDAVNKKPTDKMPEWFYEHDTKISSVKKIKFKIDTFTLEGNYNNIEAINIQLLTQVLVEAIKPRLNYSQDIGWKLYPEARSWIFLGFDYNNLLSYIWSEFAKSLEKKINLKICDNSKCKKFFITKMVGMGRYCSDKCRSKSGKEIQVWNSVKGKFLSKGYIGQYEINLGEKRATNQKFDAGLYNFHNKKLVALLEFSHSEITNKSPRFKFKSNQLMEGLRVMNKYFNLNSAFLVNKNGQIFYWDYKKNILGKEIDEIPHAKDLQQSSIDYKKYTFSKDLDNT